MREKVEKVLTDNPSTRNNDERLIVTVWWEFYRGSFYQKPDGKWSVDAEDIIYVLPGGNDIRRIRAEIQNKEHRLLPTDPKTYEFRKSHKKDREGYTHWQEAIEKK